MTSPSTSAVLLLQLFSDIQHAGLKTNLLNITCFNINMLICWYFYRHGDKNIILTRAFSTKSLMARALLLIRQK